MGAPDTNPSPADVFDDPREALKEAGYQTLSRSYFERDGGDVRANKVAASRPLPQSEPGGKVLLSLEITSDGKQRDAWVFRKEKDGGWERIDCEAYSLDDIPEAHWHALERYYDQIHHAEREAPAE